MISYIFVSLFISGLDFYLLELLCRLMWDTRSSSQPRVRLALAGFVLLSVLSALPPLQSAAIPLAHGALLAACQRYEMRWYRQLFLIALFVGIMAVAETLVSIALAVSMDLSISEVAAFIRHDSSTFLFGRLLSLFAGVFFVRLLSRFFRKRPLSNNSQLSLLAVLLPASSCVIAFFFYQTLLHVESLWLANLILVIYICLFLANVFLIDLLERLARAKAAERERAIAQTALRQEVEHYRQLFRQQRETVQAMQELRGQLAAGMVLLREGRPEAAGELLERLAAGASLKGGDRLSGNVAIDAILDAKSRRMRELAIAFTPNITLPPSCAIAHDDLAVVVGNILDNALNACEKVPERRYIRFTIKQFREYLCFKMENSAVQEDGRQDESAYPLHGFGLQNVRQVAEKYDGNVTIRREEDRFVITVLLHNETGRGA